MPRIRTIKPEYWTDEKMSLLDPLTRLVFLGLMSMADDEGRLVDNVKLLDGMLFPNTDDSSRESLEILARVSRITRYVTSSGQNVIQIVNWGRHQRVDHPNKHCLPGPSEAIAMQPRVPATVTPPPGKSSRDPRESVARPSRDPRATTSTSTSTSTSTIERKKLKYPTFTRDACDRLYESWTALGRPPYAAFRAAFGPLFPDQPLYTVEQVERAIKSYIEDAKTEGDAKYASPQGFVSRVQHYVDMTTPIAQRDPVRARALGIIS